MNASLPETPHVLSPINLLNACCRYEVQQELVLVLNQTDPMEVLCNNSTEVLVYGSPEVQSMIAVIPQFKK